MKKRSHILIKFFALLAVLLPGMVVKSSPLSSLNDMTSTAHKPTVASLDFCADQYILSMADREQISAVSDTAGDLYSFYGDKAKGLHQTHGTIAEIILLKPDVVLETFSAAARMQEITNRVGISFVRTKYSSTLEDVFENVLIVGKAIGQENRANDLVAEYKGRIKEIEESERSNLKVAYITPSGFTAGEGTFVDQIIELAGFERYAKKHDYQGWLSLPIEDLIMDPPDMIVTSFFDTNLDTQSKWSLSRHNHLLKMMDEIPTINLPGKYMACNGLFLIDAAIRIRDEAMDKGLILQKRAVINE